MSVITARTAALTCVSLGFAHSSFVFAQEANMHENKFNSYKVPSGLLILFLEKALTLIHMETHLTDVSTTITKRIGAGSARSETGTPLLTCLCIYRARSQESVRFPSAC